MIIAARPVLAGGDPGARVARRGGQDRHAGDHRGAAGDQRPAAAGEAARPVGDDARQAARVRPARPAASSALMDYIFYQVAAINGFDSFGHYLRAGLIVNTCSTYSIDAGPGCRLELRAPPRSAASADRARSCGTPRARRRSTADRQGAQARPGRRARQDKHGDGSRRHAAAAGRRAASASRPRRRAPASPATPSAPAPAPQPGAEPAPTTQGDAAARLPVREGRADERPQRAASPATRS